MFLSFEVNRTRSLVKQNHIQVDNFLINKKHLVVKVTQRLFWKNVETFKIYGCKNHYFKL